MITQFVDYLTVDNLQPIVLLVLGLGIGLLLLRFVFKVAMRVFWLGCLAILILGAVLVIGGFLIQ